MATYDVGLKIGIEGDASFKNKLSLINQQAKELNAEMKSVTSAYDKNDNSAKKLSATSGVLARQMEVQRNKIDLLNQKLQEQKAKLDQIGQAYQETVAKEGANSASAQKLANEYANQARQVSQTQTQLNNAQASLNEMDSAMKNNQQTSINWRGALKTAGVALATIATTAAAGAVALGKAVVGAYGDFEQLEGGVNKIFGADAQAVIANADKAYQTAGMSANQYMEQVTGFSASLIQSTGNDTAKAAEIADMAIRDMSDNANTFGTDISSIQSAYQGFAKGTYTMLDNLRLGYGGTKQEMERLLSDASKISGIKYDISNLDDVYSAIHVIQEEVGIAGTTFAESEGTIQGSIGRLKASFENLTIGLGRADSNMDALVGNLADSLGMVIDNITPVIERVIEYLPAVASELSTALMGMLPSLIETVTQIFSQVLETLLGMLPELMPVAVNAILTLTQTLINNLPLVIDSAIQLVLALIQGIVQMIPQLAQQAPQLVMTVAKTIIANLPQILDAGVSLVGSLIEGILSMAGRLFSMAISFIAENVVRPIRDKMKEGKSLGQALVEGLWNGITGMASWLWGKITGWASDIIGHIESALKIGSPSKETAWIGQMMVEGLAKGINDNQKIADKAWNNLQNDLGFGLTYAPSVGGYGNTTFNITQKAGENGAMLARRINRQLGEVM